MRNPVYGSKLHVGIGRTQQECIDALPKSIRVHVPAELAEDTWDGHTLDLRDGNFIIMLVQGTKPFSRLKTKYHECGHAALLMCEWHEVHITPADHEPFAYLLGWVGEQVERALVQYGKAKALINIDPKEGIIYTEKINVRPSNGNGI